MNPLLSYGLRTVKNTFSFVRKAVIVVTVFSAVLLLFSYFIQKDRPKIDQDKLLAYQREQIYAHVDELSQDTSDKGIIQSMMFRSSLCTSVGEACTDNPEDGNENFQNSLFGKVTGWIAAPYANPPASGMAWLNNSLQDAGFIPSTYAATGTGFASIQGYMPIWKLFRDISYLLLVIFILVIGFMIMFRSGAGGQTAVNIESALPRIVIALLIITFSFPIAGFLIDMMYALIAFSIGLLFDVGDIVSKANLIDGKFNFTSKNMAIGHFTNASFTDLWPGNNRAASLTDTGFALYRLLPGFIQNLINIVVIPGAIVYANTLLTPAKSILEAFTNVLIGGFGTGNMPLLIRIPLLISLIVGLIAWLPGLIITLILVLTVLLFMFRIFFMLLSSYIKIILYIIFAPIILLFSVFPGNNNISWWFKNLLGELSAFPTIIVIFLVANAITSINMNGTEHAGLSVFGIGSKQDFRLPFLYGFKSDEFNAIISLGLVLLVPDLIKMVKGWIGVSESPLNMGLGTYFAGLGIFGAGIGAASSVQNLRHTMVGVDYKNQHGLLDMLPFGKKLAGKIRGSGS